VRGIEAQVEEHCLVVEEGGRDIPTYTCISQFYGHCGLLEVRGCVEMEMGGRVPSGIMRLL